MNRNQSMLTGLGLVGTIASLAVAARAQTTPQPVAPEWQTGCPALSVDQPSSRIAQRQGMAIDQHFIEMMIPHHEDAIEMADLALTRTKRPEIKQLAEAIKRDQTREINQMRGWYQQWFGSKVPAIPAMGGRMGGRMNRNYGQGMMMDMDMESLKTATDFDREFIRQMVPHHRMGVRMALMLQRRTTRPEMQTLAEAIIRSQSDEINQMQQWYQTWY